MVDKDKSAEALADAGHEAIYGPLLALRSWLADLSEDRTARQVERRNGRVEFTEDGQHVPGPFTIEARQEILRRLLETQEQAGIPLISDDEIAVIRDIWSADVMDGVRRQLSLKGTV